MPALNAFLFLDSQKAITFELQVVSLQRINLLKLICNYFFAFKRALDSISLVLSLNALAVLSITSPTTSKIMQMRLRAPKGPKCTSPFHSFPYFLLFYSSSFMEILLT